MTDKTKDEAVRGAGQRLSNIAYNLAQNEKLPLYTREALSDARKEWDEAIAALRDEQPEAQAVACPLSEDDGSAMNQELLGFALRWRLDGDYLRCRNCERPHLAGYGHSPFQHAADCKNRLGAERKPWCELARILSPLYTHPTTPAVGASSEGVRGLVARVMAIPEDPNPYTYRLMRGELIKLATALATKPGKGGEE